MHIADFDPFEAPAIEGLHALIAIGWLEPDHENERGAVDKEFMRKLVSLLINPWQPVVAMGAHPCGYCYFTGGPSFFSIPRRHVLVTHRDGGR
jgi:hypothetical protein